VARGYALMAAVAGIVPLHAMARAWSERAFELVDGVGTPYDLAFVLQRVSSYRLWMGEWDIAEAAFRRVVEISGRLGDQRLLADAMSCLGLGCFFRGQHARTLATIAEIEIWQRRADDAQIAGGAPSLAAATLIRQGDPETAIELCRSVQAAIDAANVSHEVVRCHGVLALAHLRAGGYGGAREAIDRALGVLSTTRPVAYWTFDGVAAAAEASVALWESSGTSADEKRARRCLVTARAFAAIFPIGEPFAALWEGLFHQLEGHPVKARRAWDRPRGWACPTSAVERSSRSAATSATATPSGDAFSTAEEAILADLDAAPVHGRAQVAPGG